MGSKEFIESATNFIAKDMDIGLEYIFVVWQAKILNNNKALISWYGDDNIYVEVTHDGEQDVFYYDYYRQYKQEKPE